MAADEVMEILANTAKAADVYGEKTVNNLTENYERQGGQRDYIWIA